jgi:hypothetical protein
MELQEGGRFQDDRGTDQSTRAHEKRTHAGDEAIRETEIGCTFPGTIEDHQLVLDEDGFSHHGTRAAGTGESDDRRQEMKKQDGQVAHGTSLPRSRNRENAEESRIRHAQLRRVLAFTELKFSNSMIEAWWRSLKHQWLFLHPLDSHTTVRRLVEFYVKEHNRVLPHSAFRGQTPDEMYFGTGDAVPADLTSRAAAARRKCVEANRSASCETCPSIDAAASPSSAHRRSNHGPRARSSADEAGRTADRTSHEQMRRTVSGSRIAALEQPAA